MKFDNSKVGGTAFYQHEPLTVRLKNLIHDYPEGIGIVKELIQNADDAGASRVEITLDWRTHPFERLPDDRMAQLLGPAMLVYNNTVFSEADFKNIQRLGMGGKREILWKTGRFGVGFNSVYHVTDYPSFISCDRIVFFDPHASAIPGTNRGEPGRSWLFAQEGWWHDYSDFMRVYEPGGLKFGVENFDGTLFRLPLRTATHASRSEIRSQPFTEENVQQLLQELMQSGEELLLFLKSVSEILVCEIQSDGKRRERIAITTKNDAEVQAERQKLLSPLQASPEDFLELCRTNPSAFPSVSYLHKIETTSEECITTSTWRVSSVIRVSKDGDLLQALEEMAEQGEKAVPWAGAAARIATLSTDSEEKPFVGRAYCFLPLPQKTGLPIHINGFFDLDSSRRELTNDDTLTGRDKSRVKWNQLLVRHVIPHACANLIAALVQDIGEENPEEFYQFWPLSGVEGTVLEELPLHVVKILDRMKVIRSTGDEKWLEPSEVYVLPAGWQNLVKPLSADGIPFPDPTLPTQILKAFEDVDLTLVTFEPENLREHLAMQCSLGVPLAKAPKLSLRSRKWVTNLLCYCLHDGCKDLHDLPLAILADGTLQVFGHNPPGFIYTASAELMQIFADWSEWFLDPKLVEQVQEISDCLGVTNMNVTEVANRLTQAINPKNLRVVQWQPNGQNLPNANWLAQIYNYFAGVGSLPEEELRAVPLVPSNDGKLHKGGSVATPLWYGFNVAKETLETMTYFRVPLVQAPEPLRRAISKFLSHHPNILIWPLTVPDLIDTLDSQSALPTYNEKFYKALVNFLALAGRDWINGQGKHDQDRKDKLRQLRIFSTNTSQLVALNDEDVYIPGSYDPPKVAGRLKLLNLGASQNSQEWKQFFDFLAVPVLDHETLIRNCLLQDYAALSHLQQLAALEWIRDNLSTAQTKLEQKGKNAADLKKQVASANLVRCADGRLLPATSVYAPDSEVVRQVLGGKAPIPNMKSYSKGAGHWLDFFKSLGMLTTPSANDLLAHIDGLMQRAKQAGLDAVAESCMTVFYHIEDHWEELKDANVSRENKTFAETLKGREWLPVERQETRLKRFPGFKIPVARLHRSDELCFIQYGNLVASQKPLFTVRREPKNEVQKALGFRSIDRADVVNHFKVLIDIWERGNPSNVDDKEFQRSLDNIYRYFSNIFLANRASEADRKWLKNHFISRNCLWDYVEFWKPEHAFQVNVPFFGKRRVKIYPPSPIREVYELLGQKRTPDIKDYIAFLNELAEDSNGNSLNQEDTKCAVNVLNRLAKDLSQENESALDSNLMLLTDDFLLLSADQVLIPDAPWRLEGIKNSGKVKILHPQVSSVLASLVGSPSLLDDVIEQPKGTVKTTNAPEANELCRRWQKTLKSENFREGLERLILDEADPTEPVDLDWLKRTRILPADEIVTDLYLNGELIASDVPGDYYFAPDHRTFYLRYDDDDTDTMLDYLAESLNNQLGECKLADRSRLVKILDAEPINIERLLNKLRTRPLQKPIQEDLDPVEADRTEDRIFDEDITQDSQDTIETPELSGDEAVEQVTHRQATVSTTGAATTQPRNISTAETGSGLLTARTTDPTSRNSQRQASTNSAPTSQPQPTGFVPAPTAQQRQAGTTGTPFPNTTTSGTSTPLQVERSILNLKPSPDNLDAEFNDDFESFNEELPNTSSHEGSKTRALSSEISDEISEMSGEPRPRRSGQLSSKNRTGGLTYKPRPQQGRLRTYVRPEPEAGLESDLEEQYPQEEREKIDRAGMARAMQYEREQGRNPEAMPPNHPGYDIESEEDLGKIRYIEVKSIRGDWGSRGVKLTRTQFETAQELQEQFWLYVVERAEQGGFQVITIQNPARRVGEFFYDDGWREVAEDELNTL